MVLNFPLPMYILLLLFYSIGIYYINNFPHWDFIIRLSKSRTFQIGTLSTCTMDIYFIIFQELPLGNFFEGITFTLTLHHHTIFPKNPKVPNLYFIIYFGIFLYFIFFSQFPIEFNLHLVFILRSRQEVWWKMPQAIISHIVFIVMIQYIIQT
jgi:hypothetical protein